MSLIECQDGKFYRSPLWHGSYGQENLRWVLRGTQLLVEVKKKTASGFKSQVHEALRNLNFNGRILLKEAIYAEVSMFPPDWTRSKGYEFEYTFLAPPPRPIECEGCLDAPDFSDLKHCWNVMFPTEDVWNYFSPEKKLLSVTLAGFLLGEPVFNHKAAEGMAGRIRKLLPNLTSLTLEEAKEHYGDHICVSRACRRSGKK